MSDVSDKKSSLQEALLACAIWAIAALPAWFRGGTPMEVQPPFFVGGIALLLAAGIMGNRRAADPSDRRWGWLRDPVFYLGLIFITLLTLQWWNAGRVWFFDPAAERWDYTPAPRPGWPWAFSRDEAAEMLRWFVPAWAMVMTFRGRLLHSSTVVRLWRGLAVAAAILAAVAIAQGSQGAAWLYRLGELRADNLRYFAGFGYENHAASFFLLMTALSAGLLMRDAVRSEARAKWRRIVVSLFALLLNLTAVFLSLSRVGITLAAVLAIAAVAYMTSYFWPRATAPARVNLLSGGLAVLALVAMAVVAFGPRSLRSELRVIAGVEGNEAIPKALKDRGNFSEAAVEIWKRDPVFGVGGWGCRYLLYRYLPAHVKRGALPLGFANIHNDPLQFLAEFGVVGGGILAAVALLLIAPCFRPVWDRGRRVPYAWARPMVFFALIGAGSVFAHSLVDLPFRCPAVLWSWCAVAAGAGLLCRHEHEVAEVHDAGER